ncbi:hypothetical protein G6N76_02485 [Rhizobium daejeonense]|uniref:DUF1127 domain-containing protein n=1 Tax=Rhizobium daejeonense TaxID=240521 RepID=A0A6M1S759_9HYPH|nr:hypothetical protein [Rhizobium daejeonense]NGO62526.1 hypothetical protein [Rhizobium daejeonense]
MLSAIRTVLLPGNQIFAAIFRSFRHLVDGGRMSIDDLPESLLRDTGLNQDRTITDRREADWLLSNRHSYRPRTRSS